MPALRPLDVEERPVTHTRYHSSAPSLSDVLAGRGTGRHMARTGNKCRRDSFDTEDERIRRFVLPVDEPERGAFLEAAAQFDRIHKSRAPGPAPCWSAASRSCAISGVRR